LYSYYETTYGVFNHQDRQLVKKRPLAAVALHESEENTTTSALYESIDIFIKNDIGKHTGLNMAEFFALPREIFNKVLLSCGERVAKESQEAAAFNKKTENAFSDKGLPPKP
jgi:hypothetical protein